jgi:hypothetical protein
MSNPVQTHGLPGVSGRRSERESLHRVAKYLSRIARPPADGRAYEPPVKDSNKTRKAGRRDPP